VNGRVQFRKHRRREAVEKSSAKVARSVDKTAEALKTAAEDKRAAASISLQLEMVKSMELCGTERNALPTSLMQKAAMLEIEKEARVSVPTIAEIVHQGIIQSSLLNHSTPNTSSFQSPLPPSLCEDDCEPTDSVPVTGGVDVL